MKTNKYIAGTLALAILATAGVVTAYAYQGDYTKHGPEYSADRHEAMEDIFEAKDYEAWRELMNNRGHMMEIINENNFEDFTRAHELAESGDYEGADKIREELGLRTRNGERMGRGRGSHRGNGNNQGFNI